MGFMGLVLGFGFWGWDAVFELPFVLTETPLSGVQSSGVGLRVQGVLLRLGVFYSGFRVGCIIEGLRVDRDAPAGPGYRVQDSGVDGSGFRVQVSEFRVQGSDFRVQGVSLRG